MIHRAHHAPRFTVIHTMWMHYRQHRCSVAYDGHVDRRDEMSRRLAAQLQLRSAPEEKDLHSPVLLTSTRLAPRSSSALMVSSCQERNRTPSLSSSAASAGQAVARLSTSAVCEALQFDRRLELHDSGHHIVLDDRAEAEGQLRRLGLESG